MLTHAKSLAVTQMHAPIAHPPPHPATPPLDWLFGRAQAALNGNPTVWQEFIRWSGHFGVNLAVSLLILLGTIWLSRGVSRIVRQALGGLTNNQPADPTLQNFVSALARWAIVALGLVAVLQQLGVQTTSILAVLGAASLALGLAVQGALGNIAAGVMILINRPYRVGEWVEISGKIGRVTRLGLFVTELSDADNLNIYVPNSRVLNEMIINYSTAANRRMELNIRIDYSDDLNAAIETLHGCATSDPRILADPQPWAGVTALGDSAVTVTLRAWANLDVYWDARYAMLKRVKEELQAAGMHVAYPRQIAQEPAPKAEPTAKRSAKAPPSGAVD